VTGSAEETPLARFRRSMAMDHGKWHDGIGYDLDALAEASPDERSTIENLLIHRDAPDWYDVEALAALDSDGAHETLREWGNNAHIAVRIAVARFAAGIIGDDVRTDILVDAIEHAEFYGGLTQALLEVETFHPPAIIQTLLRATEHRDGDVATHLAAMLLYLHGKAAEPFDWDHRPFLLRFNSDVAGDRQAAFAELCRRIGIQAAGSTDSPGPG